MVFKDGFIGIDSVSHPNVVLGEGAIVGALNEQAGFLDE